MRSNKRTFSYDVLLLWISIIAVVILRSIAISRDLDFEFGYYNSNALIGVSVWMTFAACLLFFIGALSIKKNEPFIPTYNTPATYIPSALVAAALIFLSKNLFVQFKDSLAQNTQKFGATLAVLCALCAIGGAVGLFIFVMQNDEKSPLRSYFLMLLSFLFVLYAVYLYFDTTLPINAPNKITDQLAYVFAAIFFLFETKISMGQFPKKSYAAIGYPTAIITAYSSIPSICAFFIHGKTVSNSIYETVLTFTLFLFVSARLILMSEYEADVESDAARSIRIAEEKRLAGNAELSDNESGETEEVEIDESEEEITVGKDTE